jgi:ribosome-associated toxin RatA of RatAB toxin-antitoxin module
MLARIGGPFRALSHAPGHSSVRAVRLTAIRGRPSKARACINIRTVPAPRKDKTPPVEIRKSTLIGHSAQSTFDLIKAAEPYPAFLPWFADAVILARDATVAMARITINYHGLRFDLTTRNPKRQPHWMAIHLERGPFRRFEGWWQVIELAAETCKSEFMRRYESDGADRQACHRCVRRHCRHLGRRLCAPRRPRAGSAGKQR